MIDIQTIIDELNEASNQEGTEIGEYWQGLCNFWQVVEYGGNHLFISEVEKEIRSQYEWFKENFTWVEQEEIICDKCGKGRSAYRELVWKYDL
jgi:hypothetical protein